MNAGMPASARDPRARLEQDFETARLTRTLDGDAAVEAALSHSDVGLDIFPSLAGRSRVRQYQYDAEVLHRFSWFDDKAKTTWGAGGRYSGVASDQTFAGDPRQHNRLTRVFAHQSARALEKLTFVAGISVEHSDTGGTEPAYQGAALYEPVESHALRLSYALAPTIPPLFTKHGNYLLAPNQRFVGNPDLVPQKISSWEAGWNGRLLGGVLKAGTALYYMRIRRRAFNFAARVDPGPVAVISTDNRDDAIARGAEFTLEASVGPGREVFANYTLEKIANTKGADAFGTNAAHDTPMHKANFGGRAALGRGFSAAAAVGYKDTYSFTSASRGLTVRAPRSFRLDARAAWAPRSDLEIFVAGQDLLQPYRAEYADGTAAPRRFEAGVTKRFGL
jgi:outer membrane receptor protein involved in Fe transport